jgi:hypothetical protein
MMNGKTFVTIMVIVLLVIGVCAIFVAQLISSVGRPDNI